MMVWIDIETTGLDETVDDILEVAMIITDDDLTEVARMSGLIDVDVDRVYENCNDYVRTMHERSGLWAALRRSTGVSLGVAEGVLRDMIDQHCGDSKPPLCGSSVHFDRRFLTRHMPFALEGVGYRHVDVSTVKELYKRFAPCEIDIWPEPAHRATADIEQSIALLKFYLSQMGGWRCPE